MHYRRFALHAIIFLLVTFFASSCASGQRKAKSAHQKNNRAYYKKRYASSTKPANTQCFQLFKKKTNYKNRKVIASKNKGWESRPMAEVDYNETPSKPTPKPKPQPVASTDTKPDIDKMDLDQKHNVEDEVLKKNNLPAPTSAKHEQIRKDVEKKLENFENEKPIKLEPLYFLTGQDEFAFVDMDPFLVAVEYALQGKIILIEGHTDHVGDFKANVALSIKRVEKIRELMIQMGVHDDHISVVGYGEELSEEAQASDKKQNERRVDFTVF